VYRSLFAQQLEPSLEIYVPAEERLIFMHASRFFRGALLLCCSALRLLRLRRATRRRLVFRWRPGIADAAAVACRCE